MSYALRRGYPPERSDRIGKEIINTPSSVQAHSKNRSVGPGGGQVPSTGVKGVILVDDVQAAASRTSPVGRVSVSRSSVKVR